jgi:NADH-quinone oxidoreductase subunit J
MIAHLATVLAEETFAVPANVAFAIIAVFMVVAAIRVVTTDNVVHAALWLMVVLGGVGLNFLLLQAEFLAMTQFLIYLGAIVVLFLFGVMLTRAPLGKSGDLDNKQRPIGIILGLGLLGLISYAVIRTFSDDKLTFLAYEGSQAVGGNNRTQSLSDAIFTDYLIPFEVISVLLLAALIGAIVIARRD